MIITSLYCVGDRGFVDGEHGEHTFPGMAEQLSIQVQEVAYWQRRGSLGNQRHKEQVGDRWRNVGGKYSGK